MNVEIVFLKELEARGSSDATATALRSNGALATATANAKTIAMALPRRLAEMDAGYLGLCSEFVSRTGMPLVTAPFRHDGGVAMAWISPEGEVIQKACFPDAGFAQGSDVAVFDTRYGRLAMCCDADIFQPQYARLAALRRCGLLFASSPRICIGSSLPPPDALRNGGDEAVFLAGPWASAQANGIAIAFAGTGGGRLILPCAATADNSGLGHSSVDWDALSGVNAEFPIFDCMNPELYRKYERELGA